MSTALIAREEMHGMCLEDTFVMFMVARSLPGMCKPDHSSLDPCH